MGLGGGRETKKLEMRLGRMESGGRKGTQRMRLGRDGVWWEKGNTENEVREGWSLVGEREHKE